MNLDKRKLGLVLIVCISLGFLIGLGTIHLKGDMLNAEASGDRIDDSINSIRSANGIPLPLNYSQFYGNTSVIYRAFEAISFTVNTTGYSDVDSVRMEIAFTNNTTNSYQMENVGLGNYTYVYTPKYNAPLGLQIVSFQIFNNSNQLNTQTTKTNFTITTNYLANLNGTELNRGEYLYGEVLITDFKSFNFDWNLSIVDSTNDSIQVDIINLGYNVGQFLVEIDDRFFTSEKLYFLKINLTDDANGILNPVYFSFKVLSTNPYINASTISFTPQEVKRDEECTLTLNVTDIDPDTSPDNLTVKITIRTSEGYDLSPITMENEDGWEFSATFTISISRPIGRYQVIIDAEDQYGATHTHTTHLNVLNNAPVIHSYSINGQSTDQRISVNYGEDLIFTFNVSDVENQIEFVTVSLINTENVWYNVTRDYEEDMEFAIRTVELITGEWKVYISVTDRDGTTTYLSSSLETAPQEIVIISDLITPILPWITLAVGAILGILVGIAIVYRRYRSRYEMKEAKLKKKEAKMKKVKTKKGKDKVDSLDEAEVEEEEIEDIEEEQKQAQRTIKRKLK